MHIWYLNHYAGGPGIGRGFRAYNLARCWTAMGHTALVHTAAFHALLDTETELPGDFTVDGVAYRTYRAPRYAGNGLGRVRNMFAYAWGLLRDRRAWRERPDAIIVSSPHPYHIVSAHILSLWHKCPLLFEVRDLWPLSLVDLGIAPKHHPVVLVTALIERYAYAASDRVVSLLQMAAPYMERHGMSAGKFAYIPNGMDDIPDRQLPAPASDSGKALLSAIADAQRAARMTVIYAGAHGRPNGLGLLLDVAEKLKTRPEGDSIAFFLVGKGEVRDDLIAQARSRQLDQVHFFPAVPKSDALAAIAAADIGFISLLGANDVFKYGVSPNKLWDYMSLAKPVLMAIDAGNDPVGEAGAGFKANPADADDVLEKLLQLYRLAPTERQAMGERGRTYATTNHSYDVLARRYIDVIQSALRDRMQQNAAS